MRVTRIVPRLLSIAIIPGVCLTSFLLLAIVLRLAGADAGRALAAMWSGSIGSWYALTSSTLVRATPLILAGLAVGVAFRAGVWNIGAEGQFLAGSAAAAWVALHWTILPHPMLLPAILVVGAGAGAGWAAIAALLRRRYGVIEVISTIMLNFVAVYGVGYLVRGPLQEPTRIYPQSATLPDAARLPLLASGTRLHVGFLLALAVAVVTWWVFRATAAGFRVRVAGGNPRAAVTAGRIDVPAVTFRAFLAGGALAGLAGAVQLTGVTYALYENISPGYGYTAIAVALLAGLHPLGIVLTGMLFGALDSGALAMQREASVPAVVVLVIEAVLILSVVAIARWRDSLLFGGSTIPSAVRADS
ncbi:MAG: ABC transporter permease [Gemmatimonadaceae bacterium]